MLWFLDDPEQDLTDRGRVRIIYHPLTTWMREDAADRLMLMNKRTGAVRAAPWISLLAPCGTIYFANLITRETRWMVPHLWMEGWLWRPPIDAIAGSCWTGSPTMEQERALFEAHSHSIDVECEREEVWFLSLFGVVFFLVFKTYFQAI